MGKESAVVDQEKRGKRRGVFYAFFFFLGLTILLGIGLYFSSRKCTSLDAELNKALLQQERAEQWHAKALLSASASSELTGWKNAAPLISQFLKKLEKMPPELSLEGVMFMRYISLDKLEEEKGDTPDSFFFPQPLHVLTLHETVSLDISEKKKGMGVRSFPRFLHALNQGEEYPLSYERFSAENGEGMDDHFVPREKNVWSLSSEFPPTPLWENILDRL